MLLKGTAIKHLHEFTFNLVKGFEEKRLGRVKLVVDVDPATTI